MMMIIMGGFELTVTTSRCTIALSPKPILCAYPRLWLSVDRSTSPFYDLDEYVCNITIPQLKTLRVLACWFLTHFLGSGKDHAYSKGSCVHLNNYGFPILNRFPWDRHGTVSSDSSHPADVNLTTLYTRPDHEFALPIRKTPQSGNAIDSDCVNKSLIRPSKRR